MLPSNTNLTTIVSTTITIFCSFQIEGTHYWEDCPFEEVKYLRKEHRHMFHIKAYVNVNHEDRDVEFIMMKHCLIDFLKGKYVSVDDPQKLHRFGPMSCEMIASELISTFNLDKVEVSEDGENGSIVTNEVIASTFT